MFGLRRKAAVFAGATVVALAATGAARATDERVLYSFTGGNDGSGPSASLIMDTRGNLYGTTMTGGSANAGVVFKVTPRGRETVLYSFTGGDDGGHPLAGLIMDAKGNLYGTASDHGAANGGVVFKLTRRGRQIVLHDFAGIDGFFPQADLVMDPNGNLYGATFYGGTAGQGAVFKVTSNGREAVRYSFTGGTDGGSPGAGLVMDADGNLYGTTESSDNRGVVFKVSPKGTETVLHSFAGGADDGAVPTAGLITDADGNLYGTTSKGGPNNAGVVFKLTPGGDRTVLYSFTGGNDGSGPSAPVIMDADHNLYGTTGFGGVGGDGVVFKLSPTGDETVLYSFTGGADGGNPAAGLIMDASGNLYGTTKAGGANNAGVVFKVKNTAQPLHP